MKRYSRGMASRKKSAHHRKRMSLDSTRLAAFLEEVLEEEPLLEQQQRDLEGVSIRDAIVGRAMSTDLPLDLSPAESEADDELDLTTLPTLEEYRSDGKA